MARTKVVNGKRIYLTAEEEAARNAEEAAWLAAIPGEKIIATRAEAQRRIFARYPQWKQANMQAQHAKLAAVASGAYYTPDGSLQPARPLTAEETASIVSFSAALAWIESVRSVSDAIEADIRASADPASFDVVGDARWPK